MVSTTTVLGISSLLHNMSVILRNKVKSYFIFFWAPVDVCFHTFHCREMVLSYCTWACIWL